MDQYKNTAKYYDEKATYSMNKIKEIKKFLPAGGKLLDIGCGTGVALKYFKRKGYEVWGIDNSETMLEIATKKVPDGKFFKQNMTHFKLAEKFDAIICLFDTINHLTKFNSWKKLFRNCAKHLTHKGIFVFDMNTINKLNNLLDKTIQRSEKVKIKIFRRKKIFLWQITTPSGIDIVKENSFPISKITTSLKKYFSIKKTIKKDGRVYFICKTLQ